MRRRRGFTVQVDSDEDGTFEYIFRSDNELNQDKFFRGMISKGELTPLPCIIMWDFILRGGIVVFLASFLYFRKKNSQKY
ncbi:MAG: hypothetical protein ACFFAE_07605 [Candidatus Hodarchaeota archaeon]